MASSHRDLMEFPEDVRREVGFALYLAQCGDKALNTVPLVGFSGASVLEVVSNHNTDTYRCVYAVQFPDWVYVLHAFKKKSKTGRSTPKKEMNLIRSRLLAAEEHYAALQDAASVEGKNAG